MYVNLLPKSFVWRRAIQQRLRHWGFFYGILLIALAAWNVPLVLERIDKKNQLQEIQAATIHILDLQEDRIDLAKEVVVLEKKTGQLSQAITDDRATSILGILTQGVDATERQLQIQEMQLFVSPQVNSAANSSATPGRNSNTSKFVSTQQKLGNDLVSPNEYKLTLRGIAVSSDAITTLVDSLQQSKAFPIVELRSTHEQVVSGRAVQEFQLECSGNE